MPPQSDIYHILAFVGSISSAIGALFIVLFTMWLPKQKGPRQVFVMSLAAADFFNALVNTMTGITTLKYGLTPGLYCSSTGLISQWTTQASDISVLAIAITTFLMMREPLKLSGRWVHIFDVRWMVFGMWAVSLLSATIAAFMIGYQPEGSNWCWISRNSKQLGTTIRFSLIHIPRVLIFIIVILIYISLAITWYRYSRSTSSKSSANPPTLSSTPDLEAASLSPSSKSSRHYQKFPKNTEQRKLRKAVIKLSLYPIISIIFWLPALINWVLEIANNGDRNYDVYTFYMIISQFLGLANAIVYGWNESIRDQVIAWLGGAKQETNNSDDRLLERSFFKSGPHLSKPSQSGGGNLNKQSSRHDFSSVKILTKESHQIST